MRGGDGSKEELKAKGREVEYRRRGGEVVAKWSRRGGSGGESSHDIRRVTMEPISVGRWHTRNSPHTPRAETNVAPMRDEPYCGGGAFARAACLLLDLLVITGYYSLFRHREPPHECCNRPVPPVAIRFIAGLSPPHVDW